MNPFDQFDDEHSGFVGGDQNVQAATPVAQAAPAHATPAGQAPVTAPAPSNPFDQFQGADAAAQVQGGFVDEQPQRAASHLSEADEAEYARLAHTASAEDLQRFQEQRGFTSDIGKLRQFVAARDAAKATGRPVDYDHAYELPKAVDSSVTQAFGNGLSQGASLGTSDEIHGVIAGINALTHGESYADAYDRAVDQDRAQLGADESQHGIASLLGNLAGGIIVPAGLEKAGLTQSVRAVGLAARDAAIAEGVAPSAANKIAARAIAHRLASEGAAYGGLYGAASADGSPSERLLGGVEGAAGGALLGGVGIPALEKASSGIRSGASRTYDALTGSFTKGGAQRAASSVLENAAMRPIEDIVNDIASRQAPVDGVQPTLAEVAGDSGLAGLQRGVANTSKEASGPISERLAQNAIARTAYADAALGSGNPQAIQDVASSRLASAETATKDQQLSRAAAVDQRLADLRAGAVSDRAIANQRVDESRVAIGQAVDRTETGSSARDAFSDAYSAAKARTREAYAHPALTMPQSVNIPKSVFSGIVDTAKEFYGDGGGIMPAAMHSIIDDLAADPANTRTLTNIDRRLADVAGSAQVQGKRAEAAFANRIRSTLGGYVQESAPQEYRDAIANAKAIRAEQGRLFETGDAPRAFSLDRYGNPVVGDTTVPTRLVRPGAPGGDTIDGLISAVGPEQAEQTVRQELRRVVDEGNVTTEAQARSLASRYGEVAKRFPSVRTDLDSLIAHTGSLDAANASVREADRATATAAEKAHVNELSAAEQAIKASPLGSIANPDQDPASFVAKLLGRSDGGRLLKRLASDVADNPDAVAGLRRSFGQYIVDAGAGGRNTAAGDDIPALAKTRKAISTITTRAGDLLTVQQKIALQRVGRELKATNFAMTAGRPSGSDTAQNQSYKAALHFIPLPASARAAGSVFSALVSHLSNRAQVQHLITQAILDPDFAATLLKRPTAVHLDSARTRLLGRKAIISSSLIATPLEQGINQRAMSQ